MLIKTSIKPGLEFLSCSTFKQGLSLKSYFKRVLRTKKLFYIIMYNFLTVCNPSFVHNFFVYRIGNFVTNNFIPHHSQLAIFFFTFIFRFKFCVKMFIRKNIIAIVYCQEIVWKRVILKTHTSNTLKKTAVLNW